MISKDFNIDLKVFTKNFLEAKSFSNVKASILLSNISKGEYAPIQEKLWKHGGFFTQKKSKRTYNASTAANLLGYISEVNKFEIEKNSYYEIGEMIRRQGLEKTYESELRGIKGVKFFQKDKFNRVIGSFKNGIYDSLPIASKDLTLTIDLDLQQYGDSLMLNKRGSIVAIEPKSGEILALVNSCLLYTSDAADE